jgi:hypothetical protein
MSAGELLALADELKGWIAVFTGRVRNQNLLRRAEAALRAASQVQGEPQSSGEAELRRLADLAFPYREGTFYFESNEMRNRFTDLAVSYFSRPAQAATKSAPDYEAAARALGFHRTVSGKWWHPEEHWAFTQLFRTAKDIFDWWGRANGGGADALEAVREENETLRRMVENQARQIAALSAHEIADQYADYSAQCDQVRREMRKFVLDSNDPKLSSLYYRALLLSEHEAVRRMLLASPHPGEANSSDVRTDEALAREIDPTVGVAAFHAEAPGPRRGDQAGVGSERSSTSETNPQPVAWRWRPKGGRDTSWRYDAASWWLAQQGDEIEKHPLYATLPRPALSREERQIRALLESIRDNDPDDLIADGGITCAMGWRKAADAILSAQHWWLRATDSKPAPKPRKHGLRMRTTVAIIPKAAFNCF